ncbi:hypothetical protein [Pseudalkalibacillus sp. SCS-8]|uniref:hypothetical protein n=1 Tax=Pseudalkalibacillus nanhaiensis TaxID=3115291 RepID=UPI0032D9D32D
MKRKLFIFGIAFLVIVIGVFGSMNSFFVNEAVFFGSIILVLIGILMLLYLLGTLFKEKFETANTTGKMMLISTVAVLIIVVAMVVQEFI